MTATTAPAAKDATNIACECSRFFVLRNLREENEGGDLTWDEEFSTNCTSTTRNTFAPGHDAKLKRFLIITGAANWEVTKDEGGMNRTADAMTFAREFGFGYMVSAGIIALRDKEAKRAAAIARKHEREEARNAKALARAERKTAPKTKKAVKIVEADSYRVHEAPTGDGTLVTRKVGRWDYEGILGMHRIEGGEKSDTIEIFRYQDKSGKVIYTTKSRNA